MTTVNKEDLKKYVTNTVAAQVVFAGLNERRRGRRHVSLLRLHNEIRRKGGSISYNDIVKVFKDLEAMGLGILTKNKEGHLSDWYWEVPMRPTLQAAGIANSIKGNKVISEGKKVDYKTLAVYHLPNKEVKIQITNHLTKEEAEQVAEFVKRLPMAG